MSEERHFSQEHAEKLRDIFTRLSDFIAEHKLEQIVGVGPSVSPYVKALARAHRKRHGVDLKIVALGSLGEALSWADPSYEDERRNFQAALGDFDCAKPALLIDEVVSTGFRFNRLSGNLRMLGLPHKNAAILTYGPPRASRVCKLDFVGEDDVDYALHKAVYLKRGAAFGLAGSRRMIKRPEKAWIEKMKIVRKELREIANSVPCVER